MRVLVIENGRVNLNKLSKQILRNETRLIKKYPPSVEGGYITDGNTGLGLDSLTSRFYHYNVLNWWGTKTLRKEIRRGYERYTGVRDTVLYIQCWANVMRKGEQIRTHSHCENQVQPQHALSGHLCVQVDGSTSTYYHNKPLVNKNGQLVFFPMYLPHSTDRYMGDGERITIAFDINSEEFFKFDVIEQSQKHYVSI